MNNVIKKSSYFTLMWLLLIPSLAFSQGSRYTGNYKKSGPIEYVNKSNIVIEGLEFEDSKHRSITLWSCSNITIRNCKFKDGISGEAIFAERSSNISITDCSFENVYSAFRAVRGKGNIVFDHNDVKNVVGNLYGGSALVQAAQFNECIGAGNSISYNAIENIAGESSPDDNINLFNSHGTPESPIRVSNNWIRGGGPSRTGGGILLGDYGGSHQIAENNIIVNPGQYGMGIAGGNNMTLRNNKIYTKRQSFTNVGLSIVNWTPTITTGPSYNITVENNEVNWMHRDGFLHMWYIYENMQMLKGRETNKQNTSLDESILPEVIINRAGNKGDKTPEGNPPSSPESPITQIYIDSFNRIAVKYLVPTIPRAFAEGYSSTGDLLITMALPRFNQAFPVSVPKGEYYIKVTYPDLGKTEITKVVF